MLPVKLCILAFSLGWVFLPLNSNLVDSEA